jgi:transposase
VSTTPTRGKRRREVYMVSKRKVPLPPQLKRVNLNAAGIDIGSEEHWAAVPPGRDFEGRDVRSFGAFTGDLSALADWLKSMRHRDGGDGIHRRLLDCALRAVGGTGL